MLETFATRASASLEIIDDKARIFVFVFCIKIQIQNIRIKYKSRINNEKRFLEAWYSNRNSNAENKSTLQIFIRSLIE